MQSASISNEKDLVNNILKAVKLLSKPELTAEDITTINGVLGLSIYVRNKLIANGTFNDRPAHQKDILDTLSKLKETIDNEVVKEARDIADNGGTVVFDNNSLITHPGIDQVMISKSSDDYLSKKKESKENFDKLVSAVSYEDITGKNLADYLKGETTPEYYLDPMLVNIRESVATADRLGIDNMIATTDALNTIGVLEKVLKDQGLTLEETRQMLNDAKARLKGTLAYKQLTYRMMNGTPIQERVIQYQTADGVQTGVLVGHKPDVGVFVAPYTGEESLPELLQNKSKWVTFTVGEIPYKLFDVKASAPVTVKPDIAQQSDVLTSTAEETELEEAVKLKKLIKDGELKKASLKDLEDDTFDPLQECPF